VLIWARNFTPQEKHHNELESFYILEGTCEVKIENETHKLSPGDFITIPLHKDHKVVVTSLIPCKAILQRIAV
ncbi:MAG: cupin domain-containing protein, partial [Moraxellaceae bacterium]